MSETRVSPRERLVLTAIIELYIATGEPVASQPMQPRVLTGQVVSQREHTRLRLCPSTNARSGGPPPERRARLNVAASASAPRARPTVEVKPSSLSLRRGREQNRVPAQAGRIVIHLHVVILTRVQFPPRCSWQDIPP